LVEQAASARRIEPEAIPFSIWRLLRRFVARNDKPNTLQRPNRGAFLFVLYTIGHYFCHRFMAVCYDEVICEVT
jgi:hypothetical protein